MLSKFFVLTGFMKLGPGYFTCTWLSSKGRQNKHLDLPLDPLSTDSNHKIEIHQLLYRFKEYRPFFVRHPFQTGTASNPCQSEPFIKFLKGRAELLEGGKEATIFNLFYSEFGNKSRPLEKIM